MNQLTVVRAGEVPYPVASEWQKALHTRRVAGEISDALLLLQHPHVFTLGRTFKKEHLLISPTTIADKKIEVFEADRGGSITYHGPGQLIAYPIVDLRRPERKDPDAVRYLRVLEEAIIKTARSYRVFARRRDGLTGVWVGESKLASIGVNVSRGVTRHGLALNVATDLAFFDCMVACGIPKVQMTSLAELLGGAPEMDEVQERLSASIAEVLHRRVVTGTLQDLRLSDAKVIPVEFRKGKAS